MPTDDDRIRLDAVKGALSAAMQVMTLIDADLDTDMHTLVLAVAKAHNVACVIRERKFPQLIIENPQPIPGWVSPTDANAAPPSVTGGFRLKGDYGDK